MSIKCVSAIPKRCVDRVRVACPLGAVNMLIIHDKLRVSEDLDDVIDANCNNLNARQMVPAIR